MVEDHNTATELVTVDAYPAERLAAARGELWAAFGRLLLATSAATGVVGLFVTGWLPPLLDANGGRWAWLAAGAVAMLIVDDLFNTAGELVSAVGWLLAVRRRARQVLSWPDSARFQLREVPRGDSPAGLEQNEDATLLGHGCPCARPARAWRWSR